MFNSASGLFCEKVSICSNENVRPAHTSIPRRRFIMSLEPYGQHFTASRKNMKQKKIARVKGAIWERKLYSKYVNEMWKMNWSTWHERGTKKRFESPTGIEPMTYRALYTLSNKNSCRAMSLNLVHMWQASCILLGSALSKSSRLHAPITYHYLN